jgi:polar amino acid transport system substrate-binding protein
MKDDSTPMKTHTPKPARLTRRGLLASGAAAGVVAIAAPAIVKAATEPKFDSSFKDFVISKLPCDDSLVKIQTKGELVVGTSDDWPYSFYPAGSKEWTGLDADIIKYVAKMLAIPKIRVETTQFSALIPGLLDGRFDIVGDSIHWTLARSKVVEFCFPTYYYADWLAVQKVARQDRGHELRDRQGLAGDHPGPGHRSRRRHHLRPTGTRRLLQGPSGLEGGARDRLRAAHLQESGRLQPLRLPNG